MEKSIASICILSGLLGFGIGLLLMAYFPQQVMPSEIKEILEIKEIEVVAEHCPLKTLCIGQLYELNGKEYRLSDFKLRSGEYYDPEGIEVIFELIK